MPLAHGHLSDSLVGLHLRLQTLYRCEYVRKLLVLQLSRLVPVEDWELIRLVRLVYGISIHLLSLAAGLLRSTTQS
jgi:hypothetical protein